MPGAQDALAFVHSVYRTRLRRPGRSAQHPIAVAELLLAAGQPPPVVLTGLLHDVLEDTDTSHDELRQRFGPDISSLVQALTEDRTIANYRKRKAALRHQIVESHPEAVMVSLADKVAKLQGRDRRPAARKMDHYQATLEEAEARLGHTDLGTLLREQLARWP